MAAAAILSPHAARRPAVRARCPDVADRSRPGAATSDRHERPTARGPGCCRNQRARPAAAPPDVPPPSRPDRVFGVLPNCGTVADGTTVSAITTDKTFRIAALNSFDPYVFPFVGVIAALAQLENEEPLGRGPRAYVVRYATALADSSISSFLTSAIVPTLLKQDPRYFEPHEGDVWRRAWYAASRTVITRSRSGQTQFNLSGIGGNGVAAVISNPYHPAADARRLRRCHGGARR